MDQMTQQNAALVEESAAATGALQAQAKALAEVVSVFKLSPSAACWAAAAVSTTPLPWQRPATRRRRPARIWRLPLPNARCPHVLRPPCLL